ncbi:MAG: ABC transporter ATP-binding protein, partial [Clostridia bacterium]|nr:ABC transporter ATP-binding protein [Clostridia bacterium]
MKRPPMKKGSLKRIIKLLFKTYPWQMALVCVCIVIVSFASTIAGIFMNQFILNIEDALDGVITTNAAFTKITQLVLIMLCIYATGWICNFVYTRIMAIVTQNFLDTLRRQMFDKMQSFPIRYFDTTAHGDIMSHYTNDVDAIRELISVTIPHLIQAALIVTFLIFNMIYLSVWMALVVGVASIAMIFVAKTVGGRSAKNFISMQRSIAKTEGFVEEMMEGQKVVKVFCHEDQSIEDFDKINEELCKDATNANRFANILMPIMGNIGNILYVSVAFIGTMLIINQVPNVSIQALFDSSAAIVGIATVVPFLNASKQFSNNVSQVSQQINSVVMAMAGAGRVFELIDTDPEFDEGYVMLVNAKIVDGEITETEERTGMW